jgi:multimeric flavodoxin WrbA
MKIVMVNGQNHRGSTYHVGRLLIDGIATEKEVKEFFLPRDLNHFCLGCYTCIEDETKCPYYAEKRAIMVEIEQADLLVFTTPNYCMAPSAPMKAFMDLTFTYWFSHKPRACMFNKKAVVISTTAGMGTNKAIKPIARALFYWGISSIKKYGITVSAMNWEGISISKKAKIQKDMNRMAKSIFNDKMPVVSLKTKLLFNMFANMQNANMGSSQTEKQYWQDKGWLGKERPWKKK